MKVGVKVGVRVGVKVGVFVGVEVGLEVRVDVAVEMGSFVEAGEGVRLGAEPGVLVEGTEAVAVETGF